MAKEHNEHSLNNQGKIIEMEVPVKDIQWAEDSINEWGYFPRSKFEQGIEKCLKM